MSADLLYPITESVLLIGPLAIAGVAVVRALYNAHVALRAKRRMRELIQLKAQGDRRLSEIIEKAAAQRLTPAELSEAISRIQATAAASLSARDREILDVGMHQHSATGTKRFVQDVLAAA